MSVNFDHWSHEFNYELNCISCRKTKLDSKPNVSSKLKSNFGKLLNRKKKIVHPIRLGWLFFISSKIINRNVSWFSFRNKFKLNKKKSKFSLNAQSPCAAAMSCVKSKVIFIMTNFSPDLKIINFVQIIFFHFSKLLHINGNNIQREIEYF